MAIKIDLLPAYVKLRRYLHRSIACCVVVTGLVVGFLSVVLQKRQLELNTAQQNLDVMTAVATQATNAAGEATAATNSAAPVEAEISFITGATKTGPQRAVLLDQIRKYIYDDTMVTSIDISDGQKVTITGSVRNPDEYARFVLGLRKATGILFSSPPIPTSGPGGFANGAAPFVPPAGDASGQPVPYLYPVQVVAVGTLLNPVQLPAEPGAAAAPAAGAPGAPGVPPV